LNEKVDTKRENASSSYVQEKRDSSYRSPSGDLRKGGRLIDSLLPYIGVDIRLYSLPTYIAV
jgi:hypothetical protein